MSQTNFILIFYLFWWVSRIRGCFRRWPQPLLRGPEWFFNVPVEAGFYDGAGKTILLHYRMRMLIPFALDIPIVLAMLHPAHPQHLSGFAGAGGSDSPQSRLLGGYRGARGPAFRNP
jgi:hypothetical protein